jgi:hypothetical protein
VVGDGGDTAMEKGAAQGVAAGTRIFGSFKTASVEVLIAQRDADTIHDGDAPPYAPPPRLAASLAVSLDAPWSHLDAQFTFLNHGERVIACVA